MPNDSRRASDEHRIAAASGITNGSAIEAVELPAR